MMPSHTELRKALEDLEVFLSEHQVSYISVVRELLAATSYSNEQQLKSAVRELFKGTMGSLTDLVISQANGDVVDDPKVANAKLDALVDRIWTLSR